ncbi:MAG: hypothetical protein JW896_04600 [Deltaproteobacteria bacterium]|nr:hypothetical protein [Deltaproteobacteria bacterium]
MKRSLFNAYDGDMMACWIESAQRAHSPWLAAGSFNIWEMDKKSGLKKAFEYGVQTNKFITS